MGVTTYFFAILLTITIAISGESSRDQFERRYLGIDKDQTEAPIQESQQKKQQNEANHHHFAVPAINGVSLPAPSFVSARGQLIMPPNNQLQAKLSRNTHLVGQLDNGFELASSRRALEQSRAFKQPLGESFLRQVVGQPQEPKQHRAFDWSSEPSISLPLEPSGALQTSSSTEQSNNIHQTQTGAEPAFNPEPGLEPADHSTRSHPTHNSNQNSSLDLNNQIIFEGPATAPPPGDHYYISSSSGKSSSFEQGKSSNAWWNIGVGVEFELATNLTINDYVDYCAKSELLVGSKQRSLCKNHPKIMPIVARGLKLAIDECQARFSKSRWNCSLAVQEHSKGSAGLEGERELARANGQAFGELMRQPIREKAYLNAIIAAGLAHAMTKACSQGELPEECSCDKRIKSRFQKSQIEWVACSDDIDYGAKFSRDFTDTTEYDSDTSAMINTHNYEVGRRVFKSATDITCSCQNGDNGGLCQMKRCWKHLGPFSDIGEELMRRYESATHVQLSSRDPHKLRPVRRGVRKPKRKDLVYIDESPDYCIQDTRMGVLGTQNRHCNSTSSGSDSCSLLCCGRGYQMVVEEIEEDCNCKFVWCCQVKCERCKRQVTNDICN